MQSFLAGVERVGAEVEQEFPGDRRRPLELDVGVLFRVGVARDRVLLVLRQEHLVQGVALLPDLGQAEEKPAQHPLRPGISLGQNGLHPGHGTERGRLALRHAAKLEVADGGQALLDLGQERDHVEGERLALVPERREADVVLGVGKRVKLPRRE